MHFAITYRKLSFGTRQENEERLMEWISSLHQTRCIKVLLPFRIPMDFFLARFNDSLIETLFNNHNTS